MNDQVCDDTTYMIVPATPNETKETCSARCGTTKDCQLYTLRESKHGRYKRPYKIGFNIKTTNSGLLTTTYNTHILTYSCKEVCDA